MMPARGSRSVVWTERQSGEHWARRQGAASGRGAISREAAARQQIEVSSELQQGVDRVAIKRKRKRSAIEKAEGVTVADALRAYVKIKRRKKDGLPLKARTQADYLAMLAPPRVKVGPKRKQPLAANELAGEHAPPTPPTQAGELCALAGIPPRHNTCRPDSGRHTAALLRESPPASQYLSPR